MRFGKVFGFILGAVLTVMVGLFIMTQIPIIERLARTRVVPPMNGGA